MNPAAYERENRLHKIPTSYFDKLDMDGIYE